MTHACPKTDCGIQVPAQQFACRTHWFQIPKPLRDEIWSAYKAGKQGLRRHREAMISATKLLNA